MSAKLLVNGLDPESGRLVVPPMSIEEAAAAARGRPQEAKLVGFLSRMFSRFAKPHLGLGLSVDATDVSQAGWGVVFHPDEDEAVLKALQPLIEHRRRQIGDDRLARVLTVQPGEGHDQFLARFNVRVGSVEPSRVPFYLLIVGSPQRIPFSFGHLLDIEYAVGRLHFDAPGDYQNYVAGVIDYETSGSVPNRREAAFFSPRNAGDGSTALSARLLVEPLLKGSGDSLDSGAQPVGSRHRFAVTAFDGERATKANLLGLLTRSGNAAPPAFLFTAGHGLGIMKPKPEQKALNGALVCQDWPGAGGLKPDHFLAGADLDGQAKVSGMVAFHFACFGAGTPSHDRFLHRAGEPPPRIAEESFVAALPKALLSHRNGGALAVLGHVERAWGCSIGDAMTGSQIVPFRNAIERIMAGEPVGLALKDFNQKYAALSAGLARKLENESFGVPVPDLELTLAWLERNDAEGYALLGDPAVRLRIDDLRP